MLTFKTLLTRKPVRQTAGAACTLTEAQMSFVSGGNIGSQSTGAGKSSVQDMHFTKTVDASSSNLF